MDFKVMKQAVGKQFADMARGDLFRVTVDGHDLWDKYLASFPEGTPVFREPLDIIVGQHDADGDFDLWHLDSRRLRPVSEK